MSIKLKDGIIANVDSATKATQDSAGQQINTTYIKGLSVSGKTITYTKGNGSTGTITTQDTNTVYTHPSTHPASMITQSASYRFVTDTEKSTWNSKVSSSYVDEKMEGIKDEINTSINDRLNGVIYVSKPIIEVGTRKYEVGVTENGRLTCKVVNSGEPMDLVVEASNGRLYRVSVSSDQELVTEVVTGVEPVDIYVQATAPYGAIYRIGVLDDGTLTACPISDINFIDDTTLSDDKTWSSVNIVNKIRENVNSELNNLPVATTSNNGLLSKEDKVKIDNTASSITTINSNIDAINTSVTDNKNSINTINSSVTTNKNSINTINSNINTINTSLSSKLDKSSITISTSQPSGGKNGDIWIVYE